LVRPYLKHLPEERKQQLSEARHFHRWRHELDLDLITPMMRVNNQDFYTLEPAIAMVEYHDEYRIPIRWFERDNIVYADTWGLEMEGDGWIVNKYDTRQIPLDKFLTSFPYLQQTWTNRQIANPANILGALHSHELCLCY
jgi:hypothetical protein